MRIPRIPFFRIWYSTTFTVLFFILLILLGVSPADTIYQCVRRGRVQNIFVIAGVYVLTGIVILFIYSSRLYTNRSVLTGIPKSYVPVEPGEVAKSVRRMIVKNLQRSVIILWDSRPRDIREEVKTEEQTGPRPSTSSTFHRKSAGRDATVIPIAAASQAWGSIAHPGWSSPASDDLPNLHFLTVVSELPNLIEAKAVSLAPPDLIELPRSLSHNNGGVLPDARIVALLQRPATMGLREYLAHLSSFGLINPPELGTAFISKYEYARFSASPLTEAEFRSLMSTFAEILTGMTELDPAMLDEMLGEAAFEEPVTPTETASHSSISAIHYRTPRVAPPDDVSSDSSSYDGFRNDSPTTFRTAQPRRRSANTTTGSLSRTASSISMRSVLYVPARRSQSINSSSSSSLRSAQSVIRLSPTSSPGQLPYQYHFDGS